MEDFHKQILNITLQKKRKGEKKEEEVKTKCEEKQRENEALRS